VVSTSSTDGTTDRTPDGELLRPTHGGARNLPP
jgi:hypothetical protein